ACFRSSKNATDFRTSSWGDKYGDVYDKEESEIFQQGSEEFSVMDSIIKGDECVVTYYFNEYAKLVRGEYYIEHPGKQIDEAFGEYYEFLSEQYGKAVDEDKIVGVTYAKFRTRTTKITIAVKNGAITIKFEPIRNI
ncbi:hypothetical protein, partial [Butyrivibrio sp. WCD2001]|uniref:hypothetical protein n=1 Tax=Butyrivibrio sp. WCD2001 TaxID=1280681 RepID=UPI000479A508